MPASVTLRHLSATTPDNKTLFRELDLTFPSGKTGLVGRNGTGKTTLFRAIVAAAEANRTSPQSANTLPAVSAALSPLVLASGEIAIEGRVGLLAQALQIAPKTSVADMLGVTSALNLLAAIEAGTAALEDYETADWTLPSRIETALADVGFHKLKLDRPLASLSGGQRTRVAIAQLMLSAPDIILLDEPTNNLDAEGRNAVSTLLRKWHGLAIVISHDRTLLREMDQIVELTSLGAKTYGGNWDAFEARKAIELAAAEQGLATAERRLNEVERRSQEQAERKARRDSQGKKDAAKGGMPKILLGARKNTAENSSGEASRLAARLQGEAQLEAEAARSKLEVLTPLAIKLKPTGLSAGKVVLQAENLTGGYGDTPTVKDVSLTLTGRARLAISGENGSGKTTLLKLLTGALPPSAGTVRIGVDFAVLDQTVSVLNPSLTIRDNFRALNPDSDENACRAALARFMFRADAALQTVGSLSGGEMLRAGLAATIGGDNPPQLLVLDEPTNHLDIYAIAELEAGLKAYDGALIVVSHDRDFLEAIAVKTTIHLPAQTQNQNRQNTETIFI
jgi:ATPase subunit of ABC transporter with duplicated ATPase domains